MAKKDDSTKKAKKNYEALRVQGGMMFIELGKNAKEIAETFDVTEKTVGEWRRLDRWDTQREELLSSPHKIKQLLLKEYQSLANGNEPKLNSDAISKISKAIDSIEDKINPRIVMMVIQMLDDFTTDTDPETARANLPLHKSFILHIINKYG